ncbi:unnamed protein product [Effrenium voratum]|uniref:J domain-containing protein n=1 Tax=Effrenium voratum TaxID=2562239 RepID=A0AA36I1G5_9DINO|nr:unnamed protein product [Effrenium voratum]CAJ1440959.1 unnamed protein product [Effrenium voratum]
MDGPHVVHRTFVAERHNLSSPSKVLSQGGIRSEVPTRLQGDTRATAPGIEGSRVQYLSTTHGDWIRAKVVNVDSGAKQVQLDKKPGVWFSLADPRLRINQKAKEAEAEVDTKGLPPGGRVLLPAAVQSADEGNSRPSLLFPAPRLAEANAPGLQAGSMRVSAPYPKAGSCGLPASPTSSIPSTASAPFLAAAREAATHSVPAAAPASPVKSAVASSSYIVGPARDSAVAASMSAAPASPTKPAVASSSYIVGPARDSAVAASMSAAPPSPTKPAVASSSYIVGPARDSAVAASMSAAPPSPTKAAVAGSSRKLVDACSATPARETLAATRVSATRVVPASVGTSAGTSPRLPRSALGAAPQAVNGSAADPRSPLRIGVAVGPASPTSSASPKGSGKVASPSSVRNLQAKSFFRCPECGAMVTSIDEAVEHCAQGTGGVESASPSLPQGETVALDEHGRPLIVRVAKDSGEAETLVRLPDRQAVFDGESVKKLRDASEEENAKFLEGLSNAELRGFVHEVGQRLLKGSQLYHSRLAELDRLGEAANLQFFGLDGGATMRDLDNAYRKLAKKMHPDKNGGTEVAKQRFQAMKERYEALKKKLGEDSDDKDGSEGKDECDEKTDEEKKEETEEKKEEDSKKEDGKSIEYDPADKESMVTTLVRMASQLKNIDIQMVVLTKELTRVQSLLPKGM